MIGRSRRPFDVVVGIISSSIGAAFLSIYISSGEEMVVVEKKAYRVGHFSHSIVVGHVLIFSIGDGEWESFG